MKNLKWKLLPFLFIPVSIYGQDNAKKIGQYKWKESVFIEPCDVDGNSLLNPATGINRIPSKAGQKFRLLEIVDESVAIIQILDYTKDTLMGSSIRLFPTSGFYEYNFSGTTAQYLALTAEQANSRNYGLMQRYFRVSIEKVDDFAIKDSRIGPSLAFGVINFPFKYRFQKGNSDFSGAFNFGAGIGCTIGRKSWREFKISIISGYSLSSIVLDSSNTNQNQGKLASTNNFTAFSFSVGGLLQYKSVQAGIFIGWDKLNKITHREFYWQYQGKPWISVGFGLTIFSGGEEKESKNKPSAN